MAQHWAVSLLKGDQLAPQLSWRRQDGPLNLDLLEVCSQWGNRLQKNMKRVERIMWTAAVEMINHVCECSMTTSCLQCLHHSSHTCVVTGWKGYLDTGPILIYDSYCRAPHQVSAITQGMLAMKSLLKHLYVCQNLHYSLRFTFQIYFWQN